MPENSTGREPDPPQTQIPGLTLTAIFSLVAFCGSMPKWIDQYGSFRGILLAIVTGAAMLSVGVVVGFVVGRLSKDS